MTKIVGPTIFAGVYGSIRLHPWIDPETVAEDAYSVFMARSTSMMQASAGSYEPSSLLWGMNDAGQDWSPDATRIGWFQVALADDSPTRLPVQPMVATVGDSLGRFGELTLTGVQLLLPVQLAADTRWSTQSGLNWFTIADPEAKTEVRITMDAGRDVQSKAPEIFTTLRDIHSEPFAFHGHSSGEPTAVELRPPVADEHWLGRERHPFTIHATAPEWRLDAMSWLAEQCADACRSSGVDTTVLVSIAKA